MADETPLNLPSGVELARLSPEAKASVQAALVRVHPFKKAEIEAAFNARPEPITPPTPKPANDEAFRSPADGGLSYEQKLSGYRALLKHATDKQAVLDSAKRSGINLAGEAATDAILAELNGQSSEHEAMSDPVIQNGVLTMPSNPSGYHLRYERDDIGALSPQEVHRLDTETRQAFHAAGVPTALAQLLVRAMFDTAGQYADLDDAQRQLLFNAEGAKFRRMAGPDYTETARKASAMYNRLPAKFREMIDSEYGFHSAQAQLALAKTWDAISLREARAKK